jgi:hypothetical protein
MFRGEALNRGHRRVRVSVRRNVLEIADRIGNLYSR